MATTKKYDIIILHVVRHSQNMLLIICMVAVLN